VALEALVAAIQVQCIDAILEILSCRWQEQYQKLSVGHDRDGRCVKPIMEMLNCINWQRAAAKTTTKQMKLSSDRIKTMECHPVGSWDIRESTGRILSENPPSPSRDSKCQEPCIGGVLNCSLAKLSTDKIRQGKMSRKRIKAP